jgi:hypothetical protein
MNKPKRLGVQTLEQRLVPATYYWVGVYTDPATGNQVRTTDATDARAYLAVQNAAAGLLPGATDDVIIDASADSPFEISGGKSLSIGSLSMRANAPPFVNPQNNNSVADLIVRATGTLNVTSQGTSSSDFSGGKMRVEFNSAFNFTGGTVNFYNLDLNNCLNDSNTYDNGGLFICNNTTATLSAGTVGGSLFVGRDAAGNWSAATLNVTITSEDGALFERDAAILNYDWATLNLNQGTITVSNGSTGRIYNWGTANTKDSATFTTYLPIETASGNFYIKPASTLNVLGVYSPYPEMPCAFRQLGGNVFQGCMSTLTVGPAYDIWVQGGTYVTDDVNAGAVGNGFFMDGNVVVSAWLDMTNTGRGHFGLLMIDGSLDIKGGLLSINVGPPKSDTTCQGDYIVCSNITVEPSGPGGQQPSLIIYTDYDAPQVVPTPQQTSFMSDGMKGQGWAPGNVAQYLWSDYSQVYQAVLTWRGDIPPPDGPGNPGGGQLGGGDGGGAAGDPPFTSYYFDGHLTAYNFYN